MALAAIVVGLIVHSAGVFNDLERQSVDSRFSIRGTQFPHQPIAIVGLDASSMEALGERAPIRRIFYARLLDRLHAASPKLIAVDAFFTGASTIPSDDRALLRAMQRDGPLLLEVNGSHPSQTVASENRPAGVTFGSPSIDLDADGVLRRMLYQDLSLKSFPVRAAEMVTGRTVAPSNFPEDHAWIDFAGPPGTFPTYRFIDVLNGAVDPSKLRGRIVLVGVTDPAQKDIYSTAFSSLPMSGVEIQANSLSSILRGFPLTPLPGAVNILALILLAAAPVLISLRLSSLYVLPAAIAVAFLYCLIAQLLFSAGHIISVIDPLFVLILATAGCVAADAFLERAQRRRLEDALGRLMPKPTAFFISYRRDDTRWPANLLSKELARRFGATSVFMDTEAINPGQEFPARIEQAIRGCSAMLVLIGPRWLELDAEGRRRIDAPEDWVRHEVAAGLRRADAAVVPVLLEGAALPSEDDLPEDLRPLTKRQTIVLSAENYAAELDQFVSRIEQGLVQDLVERQRAAGAPSLHIGVPEPA